MEEHLLLQRQGGGKQHVVGRYLAWIGVRVRVSARVRVSVRVRVSARVRISASVRARPNIRLGKFSALLDAH
eukprot:870872-Amorphochlora_amoeboformis.AAC.1